MAQAIIGALRAELSAGIAKFAEDMGKAGDEVSKFSRKFKQTGAAISKVGRTMSLTVTGPIAAMGTLAVRSFQAQEKAVAAVDAALESMGETAGFTSKELQGMAAQLQKSTTFGDEEILSKVTANLLTFGEIQGKVFERAQQVSLDLSARLGQDLQSSAIMVGKALNDPVRGLTALTRVGVMFTDQQREQIKAMVEAGDVAGAQAIMLAELEKQYGGQAAAMAQTSEGQMKQLANAWGDFQEVIGKVIADVLPPLLNMLRGVVEWLSKLDPKTIATGVAIAGMAAAIGPLVLGIGALISGMGALISAFGLLLKTGPAFITMAKGIGAAVAIMGGPITAVIAAIAALAAAWFFYGDEIKLFVSDLIERIDQALGGRLSAAIHAAVEVFRFFVDQFKLYFKFLGQLLTGDFSGALETFKTLWSNIWGAIEGTVGKAVESIRDWIRVKLAAVFDWLGGKVEEVKNVFKGLYQSVVGGSYIPDMVDGIASEMTRLDDLFVKPAQDMTAEVGGAFQGLQHQVEGVFDELIQTGKVSKGKLKDLAGSIVGEMFGIGNVFSPSVSGGGGGGLGGVITTALGAFFGGGGFGGFMASGGLAMAGRPYIVGENGPELFRPATSGMVDPEPGGGGVTQIFNVTTPDANSFRRSERQIMRAARQRLQQ